MNYIDILCSFSGLCFFFCFFAGGFLCSAVVCGADKNAETADIAASPKKNPLKFARNLCYNEAKRDTD
mgnify:CR=1